MNTSSTDQGSAPPGPTTEGNQSQDDQICPACKGLGYVRADVPVNHPDFGRLVPCACRQKEITEQRITALRTLSELSVLGRMTFEAFEPEGHGLPPDKARNLRWAFDTAHAFAEDPDGWLVLRGGYGCGKTHLAAAIANACVERGRPVLFLTVPDLLDHLRATFAPSEPENHVTPYQTRFHEIRTVPVLILDDLGTESATMWAREKLYQIFNHRYNARLPTVVTTNHELEEIPLRLRSRLVDPDLSQIVSIQAPDYRGTGDTMQKPRELSTLHLHAKQTFETFDLRKHELPRPQAENLERAFNMARDFAVNRPDEWLLLTGTYGCGKTHLAAAIANFRAGQAEQPLFIVVPDLLDHLRATFDPQSPVPFDRRFEDMRLASFLILDDLGTESATPWSREKLYQLFDYRYNARLPTVITTTVNVDKWDPRLRSRALDASLCTVFEILAPPYRR